MTISLPNASRSNKLLLLVLAVILVNVAFSYVAFHSAYILGSDSSMWSHSASWLTWPFFIWSYTNYSGYVNNFTLSNPILTLYYLVVYTLSGLQMGSLLFVALEFTILRILAGTGMFLLVYELLNGGKTFSKTAAVAGVFSSALLTLHYSMFSNFGAGVFSVSLLPLSLLFLLLFIRQAYTGTFSRRYFILATLGMAMNLGLLNYGFVIQGFLVILLVSLLATLLAGRKQMARVALYLVCILVLSIAINTSWLVMEATASHVSANQLSMFQSNSAYDFSLFYLPVVIGYDMQLLPYLGTLAASNIAFDLLVALAAILSVLYLRQPTKGDSVSPAFTIGALLALLMLLAAEASTHKPFGGLFSLLYKYIPYLIVFRYAGNSHYEILFLVSMLSGFTFGKALEGSSGARHRTRYAVLIITLALLLAYYLYAGSVVQLGIPGIPYGTGSQYATLLPFVHSIPQYTTNISSFVNSQPGDFSVGTLPVDDDWHLSTWYDAPDVYASLINRPVYTGGFAASEFFFPPSQDEYGYIGRMVQQGNINGTSIANGFGVFGIKYLIVQGDTANRSLSPNNPLIPYSFNSIYLNLNASVGMEFAGRYNTSSIYKDEKAVPLSYATNLLVVNTATSQGIMGAIMNSSLNLSEYSIYSANFSAPILWYGSTPIFRSNNIRITAVPNFSKPVVVFSKKSPSRVLVHVSDATTPFYLVFRESYDPHWAAYYSNGTAVPSQDHIAVNGFANAWYMDRTGSYTVTLYYTPQTYAWTAWAISFAALFATIGIGVHGWKGMKRQKRQS